MKETLKTMKRLSDPKDQKLSLEQLSSLYQIEKNPIYLAASFVKLNNLIYDVSDKYFGLSESDIASYSLEQLDICLLTFKNDASCKFMTYFYKCLKNKLRMETEQLSMHKRKANLDAEYVDGYETFELLVEDNNYVSVELLNDIINSKVLTEKEKQYCKLIMLGYTSADISRLLKVSESTISSRKKSIKLKLSLSNF